MNDKTTAVTPIRVSTKTARPAIRSAGSDSVAITPDGKTLYVGAFGDGTVTPIEINDMAGPPTSVGMEPVAIVVTDGQDGLRID